VRERHLQNMIATRRFHQALAWWLEKHGDSGRPLARIIRTQRSALVHSLQQSIIRNTYKISPSFRVVNPKGEVFEVWQDPDRVVHQLLTQAVRKAFRTVLSRKCIHVKRHGGMKFHLKRLNRSLERYPYVYRTDIKGFYASIPHKELMQMLRSRIDDPVILRLLYETISAPIWVKGKLISRNGKGIPLTCPLSPLIAAIYLSSIDRLFDQCSDVFYIRYMDDYIVLAKNHQRLEEVVAMARAEMKVLKLEPHPKKTFVGKTIRGFSFLGFDFTVKIKPPKKEGDRPKREVTQKVRKSTLRRCYLRSFLLYKNAGSRTRIESYWTKFLQWAAPSARDGTIWMYSGERRWSEFINVIVPYFSSS
jgi:RNA-directed DNA polymerase